MAKAIGPSFPDELAAHGGLVGEHFSWQPDGTIEFFEDTSQIVVEGVNAVYDAHDPTKPSWSTYQASALALLVESDRTVMRCYEHGVDVPAAWSSYRTTLRGIVSAASGDATLPLPEHPEFPSGT